MKRFKLYLCVSMLLFSVFAPLKALAYDVDFFSSNDILFYNPDAVDCIDSAQYSSATDVDNSADKEGKIKIMLEYFTGKGLSLAVAAGIAGNIETESAHTFNPAILQTSPYTYATDADLAAGRAPKHGQGFGLAQWTWDSRQKPLVKLAKDQGKKATDYGVQLDYIWQEMNYNSLSKMMQRLKAIKDTSPFGSASAPMAAAIIFHGNNPTRTHPEGIIWDNPTQQVKDVNFHDIGFEGSGDKSTQVTYNRGKQAEEIYKRYKGKITSGTGAAGTAKIDGKDITIIGDSITDGSKKELLAKLPGVAIDSKVGRQFSTGLEIAKTTTLRNTVVFALGTNNSNLQSKDIKTLVDTVGAGKKIVLLTNYGAPGAASDYANNNKVIKAAAQTYSNISVADWAGAAGANEKKYIQPANLRVHPTAAGQQLFAETIYNTLVQNGTNNTTVDGSNVTIIGASIADRSKENILEKLPKVKIDAKPGREFAAGLEIAKKTAATLRDIVVFAVGTNDTNGEITEEKVKALVDTVGNDRKLVLLTNYNSSDKNKYINNNKIFKNAADSYSNVVIADWADAADTDPGKYILGDSVQPTDNIHPTDAGKQLFADTVYNTLYGMLNQNDSSYESPSTCDSSNDVINGVVAGDIVQTAKNLALPTRVADGKFRQEDASPAYVAARQQYNPGTYVLGNIDRAYSDCGRFVSTVIRSSGADPDYPVVVASEQLAYVKKHPEKFLLIPHAKFEDLKPGDVLIISGTVVPIGKTDKEVVGHTLIFTGDKDNPIAEAALSKTDNSGRVPSVQSRGYLDWTLNRDATAVRIIKK